MLKQRPLFGFYTRTGISMCITVVTGFILLALSYYNILSSSLNASRLQEMTNSAASFEQLFRNNRIVQENDIYALKTQIEDRLQIVAQTSDSYVWLVDLNGEIKFASQIPVSALQINLRRDKVTQNYILPEKMIGKDLAVAGASYAQGDYLGLFNKRTGHWLSVVKPLYNIYGNALGILQIHKHVDTWADLRTYLLNGISVTLLLAATIAMVLIFSFLRQLARPLRALSQVADKVALGDFNARVTLPEYDNVETLAELEENKKIDEVANLVYTFNNMIEELQNKNNAQRDFIASISHDLKTPLTSINGFVTGIIDGVIPAAETERYLQIVKSECARMVKLVGDINSVMEIENQHITYNFVDCDINNMIAEVLMSQEPQIAEKNLTIQADLATKAGKGIKVVADKSQIQRVLQNILQNAIKFTPENGIIAVRTELPKGQKNFVQIKIEDSGSGIPEHELKLVFDRFYKADRSRTGRGGSGLGLFICKTILSAHGQQISAHRSQLGGASFVFTLPLA